MEHFATLILRRPTMTSFRFYYCQSIRSSSAWIYIIIITITILIILFTITIFIKGVRRLDFGNWWLKQKKRRLFLWGRKCNNCSRYLWWTSKIWKHSKNMLEIWDSELTAEGGPHMVLVTTDEGVRYSDGTLLEPTASLADKVWQTDILIFWYSNFLTSHILVHSYILIF